MISPLLELARESRSAAAFEAGALTQLQREIGFDVAFFAVKGAAAEPTVNGLDATTIARAVAGASTYEAELMPVKRAALAARGVAVDTEVLGGQGVQACRYYREVAAHVGGRHSLMAYLRFRGEPFAAVMLGRSGPGFSAPEVRLMESLLPELELGRAAQGLEWRGGPLPAPTPPGLLQRIGLGRASKTLASVATSTGTLVVRDRDGYREMVATDGANELVWTRSGLRDPRRSGWPYIELFHLAAASAAHRRRALFIGCGGAVALRQFASVYPGIHMDVVERESAVVELARAWYALDEIPRLAVHIADGDEFVRRAAPQSYDVAIIDAFDARAPGTPFSEPAFFLELRRAMRPGAAVGMNVIASLTGAALSRVVGAMGRAFEEVRVVPVLEPAEADYAGSPRNIVVVAR